MGEPQAKPTEQDDPRRSGSVVVSFRGDSKIGILTVVGEIWGAVEWSEKRGQWCIEDVEGRCLRHTASIRGQAASQEGAVALAEQMVRDGTMPNPRDARRFHHERRERQREERAKQPAEIKKAQAREEEDLLMRAHMNAHFAELTATPYYEVFAEAFDLADPDLWRSNSFAHLRPRLITEVRAAIADLEYQVHRDRRLRRKYQDNEHKLARAREILGLLDDGSEAIAS